MAHVNLKLYLKHHKFRKPVRKLRPIYPSLKNELWYKSQLLLLVRLLREATEELLPKLKRMPQFRGDSDITNYINQQFDQVALQFGGIQRTALRLSRMAVQKNLETVDDALSKSIQQSIGIDISASFTSDGPIRKAMEDAVQANVDLITSIPEQYFDKLKTNITKNFSEGSRWEDLTDIIQHVGEVTESRAKLIARDQTSKMNGAFNKARQTSCGINSYIWQTAGDERVRETHAENDGKQFSWDDPPEETGNPGDDINCRCVAIPVLDVSDDDEDSGDGDNDDDTDES